MRSPRALLMVAVLVTLPALAQAQQPGNTPTLPPGVSAALWKIAVPPGREPTPEKAQLGELLFKDKRLSADDTVSCSTCHDPERGFVDHKPTSEGIKKQRGQ